MPIARNQILITLDGVKDLQKKGIAFRCRYELVGFTDDGKPRYQCIYLREGEPEAILVSTRITPLGPEARYFNIWLCADFGLDVSRGKASLGGPWR